jgi:DNA polymerase (family 10)
MTDRAFTNQELAELFQKIADLLDIKGEIIYKTLAYRKASEGLAELDRDIYDVWREGKLGEVPGVGKAIAEKIDELLSTGKLGFLENLEQEVPPTLVDLLQVPDVGPKKVALFWTQAGITTLPELEAAAQQGRLRNLPGMGEKSEAKILTGIEALKRRVGRASLAKAWPFSQSLLVYLRNVPGVQRAEAAGSLRRMRPTVGDLDLVVAAADSSIVMKAFTTHPDIFEVLAKGETKASVEFRNNLRAQLWVFTPERFGTGWSYATGSKDHNVRLRELALKRSLSLSDAAFLKEDGGEILCATEEEVYANLGFPWIPPELREDRGEIEAALAGKLPHLISLEEVRSDLHSHTLWSDGKLSVRDMAEAAIQRGHKILAITDHSASLGVAGGLSIERMEKLRDEIRSVQAELGETIHLLWGTESEIRVDGSLDYPDEFLAQMDIVIASLHISLRQPREQITARLLKAINNPHVDMIGHPTGRLLPDRDGADLDMEAVLKAAAENQVAVEINANPTRLDLDAVYVRRAVDLGVLLSINTDAHSANDLDLMHFGVATARRGWAEAHHVINTWDTLSLFNWLRYRRI